MDPLKIGDKIKIDQTLCYIEATTYVDMIKSPCDGEILEIWAEQGEVVAKGQLILTII